MVTAEHNSSIVHADGIAPLARHWRTPGQPRSLHRVLETSNLASQCDHRKAINARACVIQRGEEGRGEGGGRGAVRVVWAGRYPHLLAQSQGASVRGGQSGQVQVEPHLQVGPQLHPKHRIRKP